MASTELLADRDIAERFSLALSRIRETTNSRTSHRHVTRPHRSLTSGGLKKKINESLPGKTLLTKSSYGKRVFIPGLIAGLTAAGAFVIWRYFANAKDFPTSDSSLDAPSNSISNSASELAH